MFYSMNLRCAEKGTVDGGTGEIKAREATFGVGGRPTRCLLQSKHWLKSPEQAIGQCWIARPAPNPPVFVMTRAVTPELEPCLAKLGAEVQRLLLGVIRQRARSYKVLRDFAQQYGPPSRCGMGGRKS